VSEAGCSRIICAGSQAEYGETSELITEETPVNPMTEYGKAKVSAYTLGSQLAQQCGTEFTWVRLFSVFGEHDNSNSLIPNLLRDLKSNGEACLNTDGRHTWNYLYEKDCAAALNKLCFSKHSDTIYNVASKVSKSLKEYVETVRDIAKPDGKIVFGSEKCGINLNVSTNKLLAEIGEFEKYSFEDRFREYAL
jgi:nucleoside-diphosphate-sugar epimerase